MNTSLYFHLSQQYLQHQTTYCGCIFSGGKRCEISCIKHIKSEYTLAVKSMISEPTMLLQHSRGDHWRNTDTHKAINNIVCYLLGVLVIVLKENKILQGKAEDQQSRGMQEKLHCGASMKANMSLLQCKDMIYTTGTLCILQSVVYKVQVRYRFSWGTPFTPIPEAASTELQDLQYWSFCLSIIQLPDVTGLQSSWALTVPCIVRGTLLRVHWLPFSPSLAFPHRCRFSSSCYSLNRLCSWSAFLRCISFLYSTPYCLITFTIFYLLP